MSLLHTFERFFCKRDEASGELTTCKRVPHKYTHVCIFTYTRRGIWGVCWLQKSPTQIYTCTCQYACSHIRDEASGEPTSCKRVPHKYTHACISIYMFTYTRRGIWGVYWLQKSFTQIYTIYTCMYFNIHFDIYETRHLGSLLAAKDSHTNIHMYVFQYTCSHIRDEASGEYTSCKRVPHKYTHACMSVYMFTYTR